METVFIQIRAPRRQDPGRVLEGHYNVIGDTVVLVDRAGKPHASDKTYSRKLAAGDDAKQVAGQLLRSHYNATRRGSPHFGSQPRLSEIALLSFAGSSACLSLSFRQGAALWPGCTPGAASIT
jgi:hypothetical protein